MKIVIVTDAWDPQVNGVVNTLKQTSKHLQALGHQIFLITPQNFKTIPCPTYPSIRLAIFPRRSLSKQLKAISGDAVHIATEGPLGQAARRWCIRHKIRFTTSYHTQFPEYVRLRLPIPISWTYAWLRRFHGAAERTLVPTHSQKTRLEQHGFKNIHVWSRGVDTEIFNDAEKQNLTLKKPILINMGRVAVEKNIEDFLNLNTSGSKVVVGDGPDLAKLRSHYPDVLFTGAKFGKELASWLAAADVFVFPSKTDTFGLVLLEAMACGLPVAAYPVTGPKDIIENGVTGILNTDLNKAVSKALAINTATCVNFVKGYTWRQCTVTFESLMENNTEQPKQDKHVVNPKFWWI